MRYVPDVPGLKKSYRDYFVAHPEACKRMHEADMPFVEFHAYDRWQPDSTEELFVAESPPEMGYFYDADSASVGRVGHNIFDLLSMDVRKSKGKNLERFFSDERFLIDVVKCRKRGGFAIPKSLVRFCGRNLLGNEVQTIAPSTIFLLGGSALNGFRHAKGFESIGGNRSIETLAGTEEDVVVSSQRHRVVYSIFPSNRNMFRYGRKVFVEAFNLL